MFCPNCGHQIHDNDLFCSFCGKRLAQSDTQLNSPYDSVPEQNNIQQPYQTRPIVLPDTNESINYPADNVQYAQTQSGRSGILSAVLGSVSTLLVVACVLLFIKPGYLRNREIVPSSDSDKSDVSSVASVNDTDKKPYESIATENENSSVSSETDSEKAISSKVTSSKAVSSKVTSSKTTSSKAASLKAASSKATSSKAASSKVTSSKAASSKAASSKATSSKATSSKAASSRAASSKTASSKAASSKAAPSKVTSSKINSSKTTSSKAVSSVVESSKPEPVESKEEKEATISQYTPPESQPIASEPEPEPEPKPESKPEPEESVPVSSEPDYSEDNAVYAEAMAYSTDQRPRFDEFEWCYGQYGLVYEPVSGDRIMNDLGFSGGWKCMIIYNPTNSSGTFIRELNNVVIGVNSGMIDLTVDWYLMSNDTQSETDNEENIPDTLFLGSSLNGGVSVTSSETNTSMVIKYFWKEDGHEYALGTMQLSDGLSAYVALTR